MDNKSNLHILDIKPKNQTRAIVIWLHGLGANANDFEPVLPILNEIAPGIRYIFPNAPLMSVSVNGGMTMPAWYDIIHPDLSVEQDLAGIEASCLKLETLINQVQSETDQQVPVFLAGFSQGGVIALTTALTRSVNIKGVIALSTYLPNINLDKSDKKSLSILMMHGLNDPIVPIKYARKSFDAISQTVNDAQWHEYPMEHSLSYEEIQEMGNWLNKFIN